jgi:hypothetical protein
MEGNTSSHPTDGIHHVLRITFAIVHGVMLTVFSFGLTLFLPAYMLIYVAAPLISLALAIFCNGCVEYVSQSTLTLAHILKTAWIPPLGIFCVNLFLLPLPVNTLVISSIVANCILATLLQVYAAKDVQASSKSSGASAPT